MISNYQTPRFRADEISLATDLPMTGIEHLTKNDLTPPSEGGGRGSPRTYDTQGLAQFAICGAIYWAGIDIVIAARIAGAVADEFRFTNKGHVPDGLDNIWREMAKDMPGVSLNVAHDEAKEFDRFDIHLALSEVYGNYLPERSGKSDLLISIINREFVFQSANRGISILSGYGNDAFEASASYRITGWKRGSSSIGLVPMHQEADGDSNILKQLEIEYQAALNKAVSLLTINVSLAIRRAFQAITKDRERRAPRPRS